MKTWQGELVVAATVMAGCALAAGGGVQWLGAAAVIGTFAHTQVADRLSAKEAARAVPEVDCYRWLTRYLVAKELLWIVFFAMTGAWTALAGVPLFLLYPLWRRWWRSS